AAAAPGTAPTAAGGQNNPASSAPAALGSPQGAAVNRQLLSPASATQGDPLLPPGATERTP
ncbi:MAG: protease modulator HflC, partial [Candidatus Accumulibacter sp.]|nr:protease modulator HflC [Candidatus Accumulibacter necessarius]